MAETPDRYYDRLMYGSRRPGGRLVWRYLIAVLSFLLLMAAVVSAYWILKDYAPGGFRNLTWPDLKGRMIYRWQQLLQGRLGLN